MTVEILQGDCLEVLRTLPAESVHCCVTSPPYWGLRDYGHSEQIGLEPTWEEYVATMVSVFAEVRRVMRDEGTVWLNLGDSYIAEVGGGNTVDPKYANGRIRTGPTARRDLDTSYFVERSSFRRTIREAIDAAMEQEETEGETA